MILTGPDYAIKNHLHEFKADGQDFSVVINYSPEAGWSFEARRGWGLHATPCSSGGVYDTLEQYIKNVERLLTYNYYFTQKGYAAARSYIKESAKL